MESDHTMSLLWDELLLYSGPATLHRPGTINTLLDAAVYILGHLVEGKFVVDALDCTLDGWRNELGSPLDRGDEVVDVSLPLLICKSVDEKEKVV